MPTAGFAGCSAGRPLGGLPVVLLRGGFFTLRSAAGSAGCDTNESSKKFASLASRGAPGIERTVPEAYEAE